MKSLWQRFPNTQERKGSRERLSTEVIEKGNCYRTKYSTGGETWKDAAAEVSARAGVEIACFVIGPGREVLDLYDDWVRLREVTESGCVLVRPDAHVGWRQAVEAHDYTAELAQVMNRILGLV